MSADTLQEAYRLIRAGQKKDAVRLLLPVVRSDPRNADAWWLLANAIEDPDKQRRALERVLVLRPDDARAQKLLDRVQPTPIVDPFEDVEFDDPEAISAPIGAATPFDGEFPPGAYVSDDVMAGVPPEAADEFPPVNAYEPFDEVPVERVRVRRRSGGASPITLVLAAIGLVTVLSCGLCLVASLASIPTLQRVVGEVMQTVTYEPGFATLAQLATSVPGMSTAASSTLDVTLPDNLNQRGAIEIGAIGHATVDTFLDDAWTFTGTANQRVVISVDALDSALDPQLFLYDSDNRLIAENDDVDMANNRNSRIEITLPYSGTYTIRVGAFSDGGGYQLSLTRG